MNKLFADLMAKQPSLPQESQPTLGTSAERDVDSKRVTPPANPRVAHKEEKPDVNETKTPRYRDTMKPTNQDALIETIRKAVKQLGKEAATYRFTPEEKRALSDIVYTYKATGIRTSENEVTRVAIHALIEEYRESGETSILARVLQRLNE